jgi:hypothetical protein
MTRPALDLAMPSAVPYSRHTGIRNSGRGVAG